MILYIHRALAALAVTVVEVYMVKFLDWLQNYFHLLEKLFWSFQKGAK